MHRAVTRVLALLVFGLALGAQPAVARAAGVTPAQRIPRTFFGVMVDGPALPVSGRLQLEARQIRRSGTSNIRVPLYWADVERTQGTLDLEAFDAVVLDAAREGVRVLPVVVRTPTWAARHPGVLASPPADPGTYARFLVRLVQRYGPKGSLWTEHPSVLKLPLRRWQLWNEPELHTYWSETKSWASGYAGLLRTAYPALKRADPGSTVVAAGLTNTSWLDVRALYAAGARGSFDVAAVHPYTRKPSGMFEILRRFRREMARAGDARKRLLISEMSWSSGQGYAKDKFGWETTERGQAERIRQVVPMLAHRRRELRLAGFYWYTWMSFGYGSTESFDYAGLRRVIDGGAVVDKPALGAWRDMLTAYVG